MRLARSSVLALVTAADGVTLAMLPPNPGGLAHRCAHLRAWFNAAGADRVVCELAGAALWCAAAWLAAGLIAAAASGLPGAPGRAARATCRALLPAVLRRLLAGSAGLSVLLAPAVAGAHPAPHSGPHSGPHVGTKIAAPVIPSLAPGPSVDAPTTPTSKRAERAPAAAPRLHPPGTVRVHPGDSLWLLAAHRLGTRASDADVAAYWPRVFAANRGVIGNNPSLITPGEVLKIPAPTQQELP